MRGMQRDGELAGPFLGNLGHSAGSKRFNSRG